MCDCEVDSSSILQPKCPNTQRIHDRASVWPMLLVQAENDRLTFDTKLCWAAGSTSLANQNRHMAIAMAMHARLGMHSEAHQLVADIVQQISLLSISATSQSTRNTRLVADMLKRKIPCRFQSTRNFYMHTRFNPRRENIINFRVLRTVVFRHTCNGIRSVVMCIACYDLNTVDSQQCVVWLD